MRCISAAYVGMRCLCVRPSVTFVDHVKTNKHIFKIFSASGSHTILVCPYQKGCWYSDGIPLTVTSNAGGVGILSILDEYLAVLDICVLVLTEYIPRNADWSISWSFPNQFAPNSHAVFEWGTATLERSPISKNAFVAEKQLFSLFFVALSANLLLSKINKWRHVHFGYALSWISRCWD